MNSRNKKISVRLILEAIGKPKEHLVETLEGMISKIKEEKGIKVVEKNIKDPVEMKNQKRFYSTFVDIEIETEDMLKIAMMTFKYMPANIEIIEPENFSLSNNQWNEFFNGLTKRLHAYDEVSKILQSQNSQMQKKLQQLENRKKENDSQEKQ